MKINEQIIAIAGACGWDDIQINFDSPTKLIGKHKNGVHNINYQGYEPTKYDSRGNSYHIHRSDYGSAIPDYVNSLDAMHEAEKVLTNDQLHTYCNVLRRIVEEQEVMGRGRAYIFVATSTQRAKAFLRVLNLWIDNDKN